MYTNVIPILYITNVLQSSATKNLIPVNSHIFSLTFRTVLYMLLHLIYQKFMRKRNLVYDQGMGLHSYHGFTIQ